MFTPAHRLRHHCGNGGLSRQPVLRLWTPILALTLTLNLALALPAAHGAEQSLDDCPDLQLFYDYGDSAESQARVVAQMAPLMNLCLRSAEFFALYGAAQLESGRLAEALESLERALLLDPRNGAAQIDYAQALFLRGQLFSALDLNGQLLARDDLPGDLQPMLQQRDRLWRRQTRQHGFSADVLAGYDNNLNGAPDPSQITLTLSGEPVTLNLGRDFQPISGPYLNLRLGGQVRQLAADHQHHGMAEMRGRLSKDDDSDLLQLQTRYAFLRPRRDHAWQLNAGLAHLFFGGNALYTAADLGARYQAPLGNDCSRRYDAALQQQFYHGQNHLNSLEAKLGAGMDCPLTLGQLPTVLGMDASVLSSASIKGGRPGGDRQGWQLNLQWQFPLLSGMLHSQINHTRLNDSRGYSPLLANGAKRWVQSSYLLLQYRQALGPGTALLFNVFHQHQRSNLALFETVDSTVEIGISMGF
jgi:tetratricopeptide (TPR) repeat protein